MISLIIKDLKLQKKICIIGIAFYIFMIFLLGSANKSMTGSFIPFIFNIWYIFMVVYMVYLSVLYSDGYDEKNKSYIMLNSLPLNRSTIVISKYISLFVYSIIYLAALLTFTNILGFLLPNFLVPLNIIGILLSIIFIGLAFSIYYPIYFVIGKKALQIYRFFIWALVMILPTLFNKMIKKIPLSLVQDILNKVMANYKLYIILLFIIAVCLVILSCMLSIKLYKNRDLS